MVSSDVIVIGAGACGLIAARELLRKGKSVTIVEARKLPGGRIRTITDHEFPKLVEAGAEFIHGELPVTLSVLREYKISCQPFEGTFWQTRTSKVQRKNNFIQEHYRELARKLQELNYDMSVDKFLEVNFKGEEYEELRNSVVGFVSGYDAADTSFASTFAFRDEWLSDDNEKQFRIPEGYGKLIESVTAECIDRGCAIHFSENVSRIEWERNSVTVFSKEGNKFSGKKLIITIPVGVLNATDKILLSPALVHKETVLKKLGYGGVVKICLLFHEAFWKEDKISEALNHDFKKLGFIFSDAMIPTWWTQYPDESPLLTGWIGGKPAEKLAAEGIDAILAKAIQSLAEIFKMTLPEIESQLLAHKIFDWVSDPFSRGAYSFEVVEGSKLKEMMREPEEDTLYFAGEAYHVGENSGTVEAALSEGFRVVREMTPSNNE